MIKYLQDLLSTLKEILVTLKAIEKHQAKIADCVFTGEKTRLRTWNL
jgi:hypothetical protein